MHRQEHTYVDGRGRYDRRTAKTRLSLAKLAWNHRSEIESGKLRACGDNCPLGGKCFKSLSENDLLSCHIMVFGTTLTWNEREGRPKIQQSTAETQAKWRSVMNSIFIFEDHIAPVCKEKFSVANIEVCSECMRLGYGIPRSTWAKYMRIGRQSPRALELMEASKDLAKSERSEKVRDQRSGNKHSDALMWWIDWLNW